MPTTKNKIHISNNFDINQVIYILNKNNFDNKLVT